MARAHFIKKSRKAYPKFGIQKGDSYYWWQFRGGPIMKSKTRPKESQLTRSAHKSECYAILEELEEIDLSEIRNGLDLSDYADRIRELGSNAEDSRSNMPEQLQDSNSGELLQQRVDDMEDWADQLEQVDTTVDEDDIRAQAEDEADSEFTDDLKEEDPDWEDERNSRVEEIFEEKMDERAQEIKDEILNITPNIE
jgi:hypothetical protein